MTMLAHIVNSTDFEINKIQFKFFEPGHTFMAADSVHSHIEKNMKKMKSVYDFEDFKSCITQSSCEVMELNYYNFMAWTSGVSYNNLKKTEPRPYLSDMVVIELRRGFRSLYYKTSHNGKYISVKFLRDNFDLKKAEPNSEPRGVDPAKKEQIVTKLVPLMPESRKRFWQNLPTNLRSRDLMSHF